MYVHVCVRARACVYGGRVIYVYVIFIVTPRPLGKTTVAVKVVNEDEVRAAFEKILWVSVGQEPDVRELLGSLMKQLNEQTLKPDLSDNDALVEVKKAAKDLKCLLVLDDVVSAETVDTARPCK